MAARRGRMKKKRSRKKQGVSLIGLAETFALMNVVTQTMFRTNPVTFLMGTGDNSKMYAAGTSSISLRELFRANQHSSGADDFTTMNVIKRNIENQWVSGAIQMVLIPVGFKLGKGVARPAISRTNRLLNKTGVGSTLKL
jgi:Na+-translocating ferredoxin:NAD+ oxidoreductase RnfE subunit